MAGFNIYLNFYFMAHYFHYIQFNLLLNKLKSRQVVFTITIFYGANEERHTLRICISNTYPIGEAS